MSERAERRERRTVTSQQPRRPAQSRPFPLSALCSVLLLSGCAVDQAKEVAVYRELLDRDMPPVVVPAHDEAWTLQKALLVTNRNNEQLALSGEDYLQSLIDKTRVFSTFLPTVSAGASESFSHPRGGATNDSFSSSARGSWNIFNGFRDWYALKRAAVTIE